MKTLIENISKQQAEMIKRNNNEYLVWEDGNEITAKEIQDNFRITTYKDGLINIENKNADFRIEDIIF